MKKILKLFMLVVLIFGVTACSTSTASKTDDIAEVDIEAEVVGQVEEDVTTDEAVDEVAGDEAEDLPADAPTDAPANAPTNAPTNAPADAPTNAPADAPTDAPANAPADAPTDAPVGGRPEMNGENIDRFEQYVTDGVITAEESAAITEYFAANDPANGGDIDADPMVGLVEEGIISQEQADTISETLQLGRPGAAEDGGPGNGPQGGQTPAGK